MLPENIVKILRDSPKNHIERAQRYENDVKILKEYIVDLQVDIDNLRGHLDNLKSADSYLETLRKIQSILNEDVGFPMPCGH